jgi:S-adenosylmethionine:tRNA ribosyltransferase-isomerase
MAGIKTKDFDYDLPKRFIAQKGLVKRDFSKLMIYDTKNDKIYHKKFYNIADFLGKNDVLVLNSSKVIPARIIFKKDGKECEIFLLNKLSKSDYECLVRPGKLFKKDMEGKIDSDISFKVLAVNDDGTRKISFKSVGGANIAKKLESIGIAPLPPYIKNHNTSLERYQTVYAKKKGSVAAPTAGLHFTKPLLKKLKLNGIDVEEVILHVGLGTFAPVKVDDIKDHIMHEEAFEMPKKTAINLNKSARKRVIAVGTTSVRVLESSYKNGRFIPQISKTAIFIYPGYKWKKVDALITNFHLPKSTLLMLVSSFLEHKGAKNGTKKLLKLYDLAKQKKYRFFSFGDAMFIF